MASSASGEDSNNLPIADSDSLPPARRLYPYSVIPGGVESPGELQTAVQNDPVVGRHYADFDITRARVVSLDRDRVVYVSYRMGQEVFWTNHTLLLHKGETIITDGTHEARTRCGNRISESAQAPLSLRQPGLDAFDRIAPVGSLYASNMPIDGELTPPSPYVAPQPLLNDWHGPFPSAPWPGAGSGSGTIYSSGSGSSTGYPTSSGFPLIPGGTTTPGTPSGAGSPDTPPVTTPEPNTLLLLSTGLSVFFVGVRKRLWNRS
jgi:hypothetical protein